MKAISLTQPWATLVAVGAKCIETRSWQTSYHGKIMIHAARSFPAWAIRLCLDEPFLSVLVWAGYRSPDELPRGFIIASAELVRIERITPANLPAEPELSFGDYTPGRFAWYLEDVKPVSPIAAKGALGLWEWNPVEVNNHAGA